MEMSLTNQKITWCCHNWSSMAGYRVGGASLQAVRNFDSIMGRTDADWVWVWGIKFFMKEITL
jgi:hypothetical protein